jgi:FAD/FMN-containing dehydrogenase
MAGFDSIEACLQAIDEIKKMKFGPSELDFVDRNLLEFALATNPHVLKGYFNEAMPDILLFAEFDDESIRLQRKVVKKFNKIIEKYGQIVLESKQEEYIDRVRAVRDTAAGLLSHSESSYRAVPVIDDAAVPPEKLGALIGEIRALMQRYNQKQYGIWGHAGSSIVHAAPFLDLSLVGDRQKVFKMLKEYYEIVMKLGGSLSGEHGDGRLRGHLLPMQLDSSMMELCTKVKKIFDPHGIFNPGVKFDATEEQSKAWMRNEYSIRKFADHMPRS